MRTISQSLSIKTERLWQGNKSPNPAQGFLASPPYPALDNPPGFAFTRIDPNTLYMTNFDHLLRLCFNTPEKTPHVIHRWKEGTYSALYLALTHDFKRLYALARFKRDDYLQELSLDGREKERLPIRRETGLAHQVFGKRMTVEEPYYPYHSALTPRSTLLVWEPYSWKQLCEYDLSGQLVREWTGITGAVLDETGTIWVSGSPQPNKGVQVRPVPSSLDPRRATLVGRDSQGRWYWRLLVPRKFDRNTYSVSRIACEREDGHLVWEIEVDGPQGVLARYEPFLHAWGSQGGWLEVEPSGALLAFCVSRSDKVEGGVGVYRIWAELK